MDNWQDTSRYPTANGDWQILKAGTAKVANEANEAKVRKVASRWFLTQRTLITTPDSSHFLPAICNTVLAEFTHKSFLQRFRLLIYMVAFYLIVTLALAAASNNFSAFNRVILFLGLGFVYLLAEYQLSLKPYKNIAERSLFLNWCFEKINVPLMCCFSLVVIAGIMQLLLQLAGIDRDSLVVAFGAYFPEIENGQWWRTITGPFIHAGLLHWLVNAFFFYFLIRIIGITAHYKLAILTILSIPISTLVVHQLNNPAMLDGFVGISGAVYCLFGWLTGIAWRKPGFFPANFALSVLLIAAINLTLPELLGTAASLHAHLAGLFLGMGAGLLGFASNIESKEQSQSHQS